MEEKTFAVFTADSVNCMAEASGMSPVPHDAAAALGEDASYRMRQVIMLATQYMKHAKRRRLTVEDFNRAAKELSLMPVCGHGSQEPVAFRQIKEQDIHCMDDPEINLVDVALGSCQPKNIGLPSIKAHWLAVEGTVKSGSSASTGKGCKEMTKIQLHYYNCVTKALLGHKANIKRKALQDLKTNKNIVPMLPYLINFVISGIKNMSHDMTHLTTMLNVIRALIHNKALYLLHKPYLSTLVHGVELCVTEPLAASISSSNDQWVLRDYAARLLAEIVNRWDTPQNHLRSTTLKSLREVLHDVTKPFYSHYGAIMALIDLGQKAIDEVILPHLPTYWPHLSAAMGHVTRDHVVTKCDAYKVHGALRLAAEKTLRRHISEFEEMSKCCKQKREMSAVSGGEMSSAGTGAGAGMLDVNDNLAKDVTDPVSPKKEEPDTAKQQAGMTNGQTDKPTISQLYKDLYEYFGDSISHCLPLVETQEVFRAVKKEEVVSLGDENTGKSGEELLDNLMEQIYLEEKLEAERKERERLEKIEREKQERLRLAREAILRKKREEEERIQRIKREEEEQRRRQYELLEAEHQRRLKEEEERKRREYEIEEERRRLAYEAEMAELNKAEQLKREEEHRRRLQYEEECRELNRNRTKSKIEKRK